ncbi:hypothetical protein Q0N12_02730 [Rossellomorea marisflavi]|uniref:hypothetical protein n=1 Tax=Rossellomorea marisflavi TaxID=189381 RepID=UPI003457545C
MERNEMEKKIIENYQKDENMMMMVFAQWCVNQDLDPVAVYLKAYPEQRDNPVLKQMMELTVPKEESSDIPYSTFLGVLQLFGNEDLAIAIQDMQKR